MKDAYQSVKDVVNSSPEMDARIAKMQEGDTFTRNVMMGMSKQKLHVSLNENCSCVCWKVNKEARRSSILGTLGVGVGDEYGELDLETIDTVKTFSDNGLLFVAKANKEVVFEIHAESDSVRDAWIVGLTELFEKWNENPKSRPTSTKSALGTSSKEAYFKDREKQIAAREKENKERKAKYNVTGMKYVAQAMMTRDS